jgi:DMSO reductase anchor subunit
LIIGLGVNIFGLWLMYNALVEALKAKPETAKIVMYILIAIFILFSIIGLGAKKRANQFMKEFDSSEFKEMMEQQK